ncbi:MAG: LacI family DNA-binding transcriptional regulator [Chloroflexi bacterium]|nr:LacI family DNA-binding transcriptional regulator [Chloroflexota bacterium]
MNRIPPHRVTQFDVAKLAGVSQKTVSLVLNNDTTYSIPLETHQKVRDAMAKLGYVPHRMARGLRNNKTYTIASIIPDITNPFYPTFLRGVQDVAEAHHYNAIIYNTDGIAEKERQCLVSATESQAEGIIGMFFHSESKDYLEDIAIPVVELGGTIDLPNIDIVFVDTADAALAATNHLIRKNHTRIGFIGGMPESLPHQQRLTGYHQALINNNLPQDENLIRSGSFTEIGGYHAMQELLQLQPRPSAVLAANDLMAMGAYQAIIEAKLRIPEDIAVVGFDDIPSAKLLTPPLTTVSQFQEKLGRRAAEMIFERIDGLYNSESRIEKLPFELIIRAST